MNCVIDNLYLGGIGDASQALADNTSPWVVLSVMWDAEPHRLYEARHIPTTKMKNGSIVVVPSWMDIASRWITRYRHSGMLQKVLIHCAGGVERAPLTLVWHLMRHDSMTLDEAYELVKEQHPPAQDRRQWLPAEVVETGKLPDDDR